jgi:hypothetical protein
LRVNHPFLFTQWQAEPSEKTVKLLCIFIWKDIEKRRRFYEPIVADLNRLQANSLSINTFNGQLIFSFSTLSSDNLAAHNMGGFQMSFSSGHFCRRCLVSYRFRAIPLTDMMIIQRTEDKHNKMVEYALAHPNEKSIFGVTGPSVLEKLEGFHAIKSLPFDCMHDFFEGGCPLIILALLKEASALRLITYGEKLFHINNVLRKFK